MIGAGGDGVIAAGDTLLSAAAMDGLYARQHKSFGPQIRGGESSCRVRVSTKSVYSVGNDLDVLIIFSWKDYARFAIELPVAENGVTFYDEALKLDPKEIKPTGSWKREAIPVPFTAIAQEKTGGTLSKNLVALGVVSEACNIAPEKIKGGIERKFSKKGEAVLRANSDAFAAGREWARENLKGLPIKRLNYTPGAPKIIMDGNMGIAAGAVFAGCNFFAGYPITPATEIMQWIADEFPRLGCPYVQAEDEIAAIAMCTGASFSGAKAMTATSGPGMSLKTEILGLATMAEIPMVVVNVQRAGPSTGIPTKGEQADLLQAVFSANGDVVRPVLAPRDIMSCFDIAVEAFNIAEEYQTPVVILSDQFIGQSQIANDPLDPKGLEIKNRRLASQAQADGFNRFKITPDYISPVSIPGEPRLQYLAAGIEHTEIGWPSSDIDIHQKMTEKRIKKLEPLRERKDLFFQTGNPKARIGIISWGSSTGAVRDAVEMAEAEGTALKVLVPYLISPIAKNVYREFFDSIDKLLIVEVSYLGQLYLYLRTELDFPKNTRLLTAAGGMNFTPCQIFAKIKEMTNE
ncbi:MAG: 2-oxoacid:acceptor oxidoreductase subunit alpha [Myxococcota bacterium]